MKNTIYRARVRWGEVNSNDFCERAANERTDEWTGQASPLAGAYVSRQWTWVCILKPI